MPGMRRRVHPAGAHLRVRDPPCALGGRAPLTDAPLAPDWSVRGKAAEKVLADWYAAFAK